MSVINSHGHRKQMLSRSLRRGFDILRHPRQFRQLNERGRVVYVVVTGRPTWSVISEPAQRRQQMSFSKPLSAALSFAVTFH
jgi:hypothetical protein